MNINSMVQSSNISQMHSKSPSQSSYMDKAVFSDMAMNLAQNQNSNSKQMPAMPKASNMNEKYTLCL